MSHISEDYFKRQFRPLVGATIVGLGYTVDCGVGYPVLKMKKGRGKKAETFDVLISSDAEGNNGGSLFVENVQSVG